MEQATPKSNIIPGMRYRDAYASIDWLCSVLGFERHLVVPGDAEGSVAHAQLVLGNGMIMLGSFSEDIPDNVVVASTADGMLTQAAYIVVDDIEGCYERGQGGGGQRHDGADSSALRRQPLRRPRPRGTALERRHVRPVGVCVLTSARPASSFPAPRPGIHGWRRPRLSRGEVARSVAESPVARRHVGCRLRRPNPSRVLKTVEG